MNQNVDNVELINADVVSRKWFNGKSKFGLILMEQCNLRTAFCRNVSSVLRAFFEISIEMI